MRDVGRQHGIHVSPLYRWRHECRRRGRGGPKRPPCACQTGRTCCAGRSGARADGNYILRRQRPAFPSLCSTREG
ncbi:hypothetical protein [Komagataeibacter europaeus]|uniref:hypothetical protein n=1 Tax=Komagataeibacter europaeus TaxID=33995 RepID=UPI0038D22537